MIRKGFQYSVSVVFSFALVIPCVLTSSLRENDVKFRNENVNPCDNFYQYVCDNYNDSITPEEKFKSHTVEAGKLVEELIEETAARNNEFRPFKLIEQVYNTCMNETIALETYWPLRRIVKEWKALEFNWVDHMIKGQDIGMPVKFLDIQPEATPEDHSISMSYILNIAPDEFKKNISDPADMLRISYTAYLMGAFTSLGNTLTNDQIEELVEFERKISEIHQRSYDGPYLTSTTFEDLTKKYPSVNWEKLISKILLRNIKPATKIQDLVFLVPPSFSDFLDLLAKTPKNVQANYAAWKILQNAVPFLDKTFLQIEHIYCSKKNCKDRTRKNACLNLVEEYLKPAVTLAYAKAHFTSEIESLVVDIAARVKDQYIQVINQSAWLDQQTKDRGVEIIKDTRIVIGYDQRERSDADFVEFYKDLEINTTNFLQTMMNLEKFDVKHRFNNAMSLGSTELVDPLRNFYFRNVRGTIYMPLSSLAEPFFNPRDPIYKNIGSIGGFIAFILTKNIVHLGRNLDRGKEIDNQVISCLRRQLVPLQNPKANQLLNSLDLGIQSQMAFKIAYLAYRHWATEHHKGDVDNKLFWINSMEAFCRKEPTATKVIENKYYDFEYHILKALTSVPQFWKDFSCKKDQSMFVKNFGESCAYL